MLLLGSIVVLGQYLSLLRRLEENIGTIAACIPTLKPLFRKLLRYPSWPKKWGKKNNRAQDDDQNELNYIPRSDGTKTFEAIASGIRQGAWAR